MHTYATNCPWHPRLIMWLAFGAIVLSAIIGWAWSRVQGVLGIPLGGVSAIGLFGVLYLVFDKWLWRIPRLRSFLLVPDLNGAWNGTGRTILKNGSDVSIDWQAQISITQSWSNISIVLRTSQSTSNSIAASLYRVHGQGYRLIYHYDNTPAVDQTELKRHSGLCDLMFDDAIASATGKYFTDRDRLTVGTMTLAKEQRT